MQDAGYLVVIPGLWAFVERKVQHLLPTRLDAWRRIPASSSALTQAVDAVTSTKLTSINYNEFIDICCA